MITVLHKRNERPTAYGIADGQAFEVLGSGYFCGRQRPNYPMPAIPMKLYPYRGFGTTILCLFSPDDTVCYAYWFKD